jgi:hypothetical protein
MTAPALPDATQVDEWRATIHEITQDQTRLATLTDPIDIAREVAKTVMSYQKDFAQRLVELRDSSYKYIHEVATRIQRLDGEVVALTEVLGEDESHLSPEDAADVIELAQGARIIATRFLERASGLDDEQRAHLQRLIAIADKVEKRVEEIAQEDDGDEDEDAEDEATS